MTDKEFFENMFDRDIELHKKKIAEATTELQKEFWTRQLDILLKGIEEFKRKTEEGTH